MQRTSGDGGISRSQSNSLFCRDGRQRQLQDQGRSRRKLYRGCVARRRQEPVQAGDRIGWGQGGFHAEQIVIAVLPDGERACLGRSLSDSFLTLFLNANALEMSG